jgi:MFS family permease
MKAPSTDVPAYRRALTRTVVALGIVSLLTDAASDMMWPLLPVFLVEHLHRSVSYVGLIEGVADATASLAKYFAGRYSDTIARKKPLVFFGYALSSLSRPLLALASSPWQALGIRFSDRIGKGIRGAPRDALLAGDTPAHARSMAFGYHRAMDNLGAVIGPLVASWILWRRPNDLRFLFAASIVPGVLSLLAIAALVREAPSPPAEAQPVARGRVDLGATFRAYLGVVALFTLANASDFFLVARARDAGLATRFIPIFWAGLSLLRAIGTAPGGWLADRWGRRRSLALGWFFYAVAYALFAFATTPIRFAIALLVYGTYYALTEGAQNALVAAFVPREHLGRAYGVYALVVGLLAIPASASFGWLFRYADGRYAFLAAAAVALVASLAMTRLVPPREPHAERVS